MSMALQVVTPSPDAWDAFVCTHPRAHLLQLSAWGDLKAAFGWQPVRVALADSGGALVAGVQLLLRPFPLRLGCMAYAPYGPLVNWSDTDQCARFWQPLTRRRKRTTPLSPKIAGHGLTRGFAACGFRRVPVTIQPAHHDARLTGDEDTIQTRMNQGTRRNIRKSIKQAIDIREGTRADVASFNALLAETGDRSDFGVHTPAYYELAYDLFVPHNRAALILGSYGGEDLAGVMVFALGDWAWYFYGASSDRERQRMASYGVQWAAIQWARVRGAKVYDMYGVPDEDPETLEAQFEQRNEGLWGVYRFKRGWGGP
jgi:lipid II:glycine glycyltransferase (peptidoglycan interpeptide bridge formation enzyme)